MFLVVAGPLFSHQILLKQNKEGDKSTGKSLLQCKLFVPSQALPLFLLSKQYLFIFVISLQMPDFFKGQGIIWINDHLSLLSPENGVYASSDLTEVIYSDQELSS